MEIDILLLTIYFIVVSYVVYKMALSVEAQLEDQIVIQLDRELLQSSVANQLQQQGYEDLPVEILDAGPMPLNRAACLSLTIPIQVQDEVVEGTIAVQVSPQGTRPIEPPIGGLTVQIVNTVPAAQVIVDWDSSSLSLHNNLGRRVIRQTPGMRMDLVQAQVHSVINPRQSFSATVTSEDSFGRSPDTQLLQPTAPLVNLGKVLALPPPLRTYALELLIGIQPMVSLNQPVIRLLLPFRFEIGVLPDQPAIPLFRWILSRRDENTNRKVDGKLR
ncbi:hypothetical protein [Pseudanabaena sp. FACHB-2040]|uniref:hypothetical protein n=1 Tax=Pseudanabaena sp. FACHB-2040 TaxID=2692859 RepID=UPI0016880170|nr:hypothetical protein [Pseudanabaena sp. FACHB-2040]MBD2257658.1 hypothetical protein [Pseudanabaena sp. FACHB-2040]